MTALVIKYQINTTQHHFSTCRTPVTWLPSDRAV